MTPDLSVFVTDRNIRVSYRVGLGHVVRDFPRIEGERAMDVVMEKAYDAMREVL